MKSFNKQNFTCPNCRSEIILTDFVDLRIDDENMHNLNRNQAIIANNNYSKHYINDGVKKTTKKDLYLLLDYEGQLKRRLLLTSYAEYKLKVFKTSLLRKQKTD